MLSFFQLLLVAGSFTRVSAFPGSGLALDVNINKRGSCPPFSGNFTVNLYQSYPESADFDTTSCLLYFSNLYNSSVSVYDPYRNRVVDILRFPGITENDVYHVSGVGIDRTTGFISIVANAGVAFMGAPRNVSGPNDIVTWDPATRTVASSVDLTQVTQQRYGGFQDVEFDPDGNIYALGTFPGSILKISGHGTGAPTVTEWWVRTPINTTVASISGLAANGWILLAGNNEVDSLVKFDMRSATGTPVTVPITPSYTLNFNDGLYLPPRYNGTVALAAQNGLGITVLRSRDGAWDESEYLGTVPPFSTSGGTSTAAVQIANSLYEVVTNFADTVVPGTFAGNRTEFPFYDITAQVEALLAAQ